MKKMEFDSETEKIFYDFMIDNELLSMVKDIKSQVWVRTYGGKYKHRRIDFVLTLTNGQKMYIEMDGSYHNTKEVQQEDYIKDFDLSNIGVDVVRINYKDFLKRPEETANKLEGLIDNMSGD